MELSQILRYRKQPGVPFVLTTDTLAVSMPMTEAAHSVFQQAVEAGYGDQAFYATVRRLEDLAGAEVAPLSPLIKEDE